MMPSTRMRVRYRSKVGHGLVVPLRFMSSAAYLVAVLMAIYTFDDNVNASVAASASGDEKDRIRTSLYVAWGIAVACHVVDFAGLLSAATMFFLKANLLHFICHGAGTVLTGLFIARSWHADVFWYIVPLCSVVPTLVEAAALLQVFVLGTSAY